MTAMQTQKETNLPPTNRLPWGKRFVVLIFLSLALSACGPTAFPTIQAPVEPETALDELAAV